MIGRLIVALAALSVGLSAHLSEAQTGGTPSDLEDNPWRILINDFHDSRLTYLYGEDQHRTERTFEELANSLPSYEAHLGANLYPNQGPLDLYDSHCSGLNTSELDELLDLAK